MTKAPLIRGVKMALNTLNLFPRVIAAIQLKTDKIALTDEPAMHATDLAVELSAQGMPFRDAYQQVLQRYDQLKERNAQTSIGQRQSPGACANLMLDELAERFAALAT